VYKYLEKLRNEIRELERQAEPDKQEKKASPKSSPKVKASPKQAAEDGDVDPKVKVIGDKIRTVKERLQGEGLSGKQINEHEEITALVEQLAALRGGAPAKASPKGSPKGSPKQAPKKSPKASPKGAPAAAAGSVDIEAQKRPSATRSGR